MDLVYVGDESAAAGDSADATTVRILEAAYRALSQGGVRRTTMNQIAETAGLGVATVYRRFPRKVQLVRAMLLREAVKVVAEVDRAIKEQSTVEGQAAAGFTAFAHAVADRPLLVRLLRGDSDYDGETVPPGELADQIMVLVRDYIASWIREIQAEGRYLSVEADIVAEIQARLALSLVLAPEGEIPMHDDAATRGFATTYLVPLLGSEHA
ncbi:TetR/AcrR family transcriptional regulator [Nocardioides bizhenqiangii]|uniref:Helix-turn-helix domain-containing protein n=1 Tax=Nocardioides bizhenqiangii TaxID=3095076 RepID=A0ABZ0ZML9_9ACTN|nr:MULTISPECIES: helix-turn-helix domain-containing protein [unclassified Nocardioides]MDZ5620929.1 helix-turn-helix domain-containing protein [Nocardioides sp. HM23]WQQ25290.1 helix-turn-helix domain-containing protein [Nocardioides sp. HM61]